MQKELLCYSGIRQGSLLLPGLSQIHGETEDFVFLLGKSGSINEQQTHFNIKAGAFLWLSVSCVFLG